MTALMVERAGPACTVQDAGRSGYLRFGVTPAGPMDWVAHQTANLLAGNAPGMGAIEIGPGGLWLTVEGGAVQIGLCAVGFRVRRDGSDVPTRARLILMPGARLQIAPGRSGVWAYVAVGGGFATPAVMGSLATHLRSGIGPFGGGALVAGQVLPLTGKGPMAPEAGLFEAAPASDGVIRYVPGPQDDYFDPETQARFATATYAVAARSDRMAYRLSGPPLRHAKGHDIVSDGIPLGAIQVPGDGLPLVLMADRQPTGGYPKIGTVIRADLPRLAQMRAGQPLRFAPVTVAEAVAALRACQPDPASLQARLRPIRYVAALGPQV